MAFNIEDYELALKQIYGASEKILQKQTTRYKSLGNKYSKENPNDSFQLFSAPGRVELSGNHTDHNHGRVLAASVNLDSIAAAGKNDSNQVLLHSDGYEVPFRVDLNRLQVDRNDKGSTVGLIRGIAARLKQINCKIGGFNAHVSSEVLPGSGLSSSASIELLIGNIFNHLYNDGSISDQTLAKTGQYAENKYFGKPCGLMDQMACAVGGIISIDFENPENPKLEEVEFDFNAQNYSLLVVDTGGNHVDLTKDYAAVPNEMKDVAAELDGVVLREFDSSTIISRMPELRLKLGDRAVLRAMHFYTENSRVQDQVLALRNNDFRKFLDLTNASGTSSFKYLQNCFSTNNVREQGVSLALVLSEKFITEIGQGACRVHGGGFAGTILVLLPNAAVAGYKELIEAVFGKGSVLELSIRSEGSIILSTNS